VALVDLRDGQISGQHSLPCQPVGKPVVGDFNSDGWTDFIVLCPEGSVLLCAFDLYFLVIDFIELPLSCTDFVNLCL